ncbi:hypothetical protein H0H92_002690 [Tricholoma furcatifolium]|nr:hypothetical protein H0H92_002690 [Tricholoma furcatifolium]
MLVLTDGACSGNGEENARAGLGIALGSDERMWLSIPVDHEIDGNARRTSQRAELLAAIYGLKFLYETRDPDEPTCKDGRKRGHSSAMDSLKFAVATDSEYVVKGITQWFPTWRENGWRNSQGRLPANLDLFKRLDDLATEIERFGYKVGFWHINREYNAVADRLAKNATRF